MSRYGDDHDGEDFPNQAALWEASYQRALKGRRGRETLADLREALTALPDKRLIGSALCTVGADKRREEIGRWGRQEFTWLIEEQGEGVCAIGAYLWHKQVKAGADPARAFASLPTLLDTDSDLWETAALARDAGVAITLAWRLAYRNDETFGGMTPEERYAAFIAWIDRELAGDAA